MRKHPERISSIVLLNTYYTNSPTLKLPALIALSSKPLLKPVAVAVMNNTTVRNWLLNYQADKFLENAPDDTRTRFKSFLLPLIQANFDKQGSVRAFNAMTGDLNHNVEENTKVVGQLAQLDIPVNMVWGGGDPYLNVGVAQDLAKQFKHAEVHVLPLGH